MRSSLSIDAQSIY